MSLPAPSFPGALLHGRPDPVGLAVGLLLLAGYAAGLARLRRRGAPWSAWRTAAWAGGTLLWLACTAGPVAAYARDLAWVQAVQVCLVLLVAPVLLVAGRPVQLAGAGSAAARATGSAPVRLLSSPLLAPLLVPVCLGLLWGGPLLLAADRHPDAVGGPVQLGLLAVGALLALGLLGDGVREEASGVYGLAAAVGFVELLLDAVPGIGVRLETHVLAAPYWLSVHRPWGPAPLADQQTAGAVLWGVAEVLDLPFLVVVLRRWLAADAREARRVDAELDARDAVEAAAARVTGEEPPEVEPGRLRPWWETDPDRLGAARSARYRQGRGGG